MKSIELSKRQREIVDIISKNQPITGDNIATKLGTSRSTIRTDLEVLTKLDYLEAKPKVGYLVKNNVKRIHRALNKSNLHNNKTVSDVMSVAVAISEKDSLHDAVIRIFLEDVGSLFIIGDKGLSGIVSRKDIVKAMMGNSDLSSVPVSMIMTRMPNVVTVKYDSKIVEAINKLIVHEIDSLPVIREEDGKINVVGRFTKTNATKLYYETLNPTEERK